ncbi:MAG TPA: formate--tetrahydrofolate ligase [Planctomycetota bacterium]
MLSHEVESGTPQRRISEVAKELGLDAEAILPHGRYIAKIPIDELMSRADKPDGKLILVSAMTPTPQGEGKTTTTIGLGDGLRCLGHKSAICLREPSLGPYFGMKGGGTGSGKAQVVPAEDINLHFVGDMYAVEKANNLLATMVDNHLQHGNELRIDPRRVALRRVIDLNDRALRDIIIGLGGVKNGVPRRDGFNITPASEVMAILCLARDYQDLGRRLGQIVVGFTYDDEPVLAKAIEADGAMQILLRDAIHPNLVQTMEGTPAFVHAGPFANIAQGTNSAIATRMALKLADYVVTEAGFATDLGAEKFMHIKCRSAGLRPQGVVIVVTMKAIAYHGGFSPDGGLGNLAKHIENIRLFGLEPVIAINHFTDDKPEDIEKVIAFCKSQNVEAELADHYSQGGKGATRLAQAVLRSVERNSASKLRFLYELKDSLKEKITKIAKQVYGASEVVFDKNAKTDMALLNKNGFGHFPVCIAKTPLSLSDEPTLRGRPRNFRITVNELRVAAGAEFVVVICGSILTMPGLPKVPAAARMKVLPDGRAVGLS